MQGMDYVRPLPAPLVCAALPPAAVTGTEACAWAVGGRPAAMIINLAPAPAWFPACWCRGLLGRWGGSPALCRRGHLGGSGGQCQAQTQPAPEG